VVKYYNHAISLVLQTFRNDANAGGYSEL